MSYSIIFASKGTPLHIVNLNPNGIHKPSRWVQSSTVPDSITIKQGETIVSQKDLTEGIGKKSQQVTRSASIKLDSFTLLANVTIGYDKTRPSYNYTVSTKSKSEIASCEMCGSVFKTKLSLHEPLSLCVSCREKDHVRFKLV